MRTIKASLRQAVKEELTKLSEQAFVHAGEIIALAFADFLPKISFSHNRIGLFKSMPDEISTAPLANLLAAKGFSLFLPKLMKHGPMQFCPFDTQLVLDENCFSASQMDLIFVPGRAFDLKGHRLGRGKGHYDRSLHGIKNSQGFPLLLGLAMDQQVKKSIPCEAHDVSLDIIICPRFGLSVVAKD
jgi:5-formyltetrahydrofolate cyclo-ligase